MQALSLSGLKLTSVQLLSDGTEQLWGAGDRDMQLFTFQPDPCLSTWLAMRN